MVPADDVEQMEFAQILPTLEGCLRRRFRFMDEDAKSEHVSEGVAHAFGMFLSARRRGKRVLPAQYAYMASKMVLSGRRFGISQCVRDACSPVAIAQGRTNRPISLSDGNTAQLIVDRWWRWPVVDYVAALMDWHKFRTSLSYVDSEIVDLLERGHRRFEVASAMGVSRPAISQRLARLERRWTEFQSDAPTPQ